MFCIYTAAIDPDFGRMENCISDTIEIPFKRQCYLSSDSSETQNLKET